MVDVSVPDNRNIVRNEAWKIEWSDILREVLHLCAVGEAEM